MANSYPTASLGPFEIFREPDQDSGVSPSGKVAEYTAGASLKLGESVYFSAAKTVNKSNSAGNAGLVAGVVCGGYQTGMQVLTDINLINVMVAALVNEPIIVLWSGVYWIISDAAIAVGTPIKLGTTTAGRVMGLDALSGSIGTLALTGAPGIGTLDATVDAGATPVTSSAANGAIATVIGAPSIGTLAITGSPGGQSGDGTGARFGRIIEVASGAAQVKLALINV